MGEWSKKVGATGESIAADFLRLVGWDAAQSGVELPCVRPEVHEVSGHARRTHGIDYLLGYRSPLVDGVCQNLIYARRIANGCDVEFFYPDTGKNVNPLCHVKHGRMLPVEYINSSVLPMRIADKALEKRILLLSTLERFSEGGLKRLLGLAQHLSQGWCSRVVIAFPDYDHLQHGNSVQLAKGSFSNSGFANAAEIHCYDEDFRSLRHLEGSWNSRSSHPRI